MPKRVQLPDGNIGEFPDSMSNQEIESVLQKQFPVKHETPVKAESGVLPRGELYAERGKKIPAEGSIAARFGPGVAGYTEAARQGAAKFLGENAPLVMGAIGGLAGGLPGAALGGSLAGAAQHPETPVSSGVGEGVKQAVYEFGGKLAGKAVGKVLGPMAERVLPVLRKYPVLAKMFPEITEKASPKAVQHLTAAAASKQTAGKVIEEIGHTIDDIGQEMAKLPAKDRTVSGFLGAVNSRKSAMNLEYERAMQPVAGVQTNPTGVADRIRSLARSYMGQTAEGKAKAKAIEKAAQEFDKPWTFGQLDSLRTDLGSQLSRHKMKGSVAKYTAEKGDVELAIDNAILDGLRETIYPEMDRAAGKAAGYFENMKARQSSLITLQSVLEQRVKDLSGAQAVGKAQEWYERANFGGAISSHGEPHGWISGAKEIIAPTREMKMASSHVQKAFPVATLPYQFLFANVGRATQVKGPKQKRLEETRDNLIPANE